MKKSDFSDLVSGSSLKQYPRSRSFSFKKPSKPKWLANAVNSSSSFHHPTMVATPLMAPKSYRQRSNTLGGGGTWSGSWPHSRYALIYFTDIQPTFLPTFCRLFTDISLTFYRHFTDIRWCNMFGILATQSVNYLCLIYFTDIFPTFC